MRIEPATIPHWQKWQVIWKDRFSRFLDSSKTIFDDSIMPDTVGDAAKIRAAELNKDQRLLNRLLNEKQKQAMRSAKQKLALLNDE